MFLNRLPWTAAGLLSLLALFCSPLSFATVVLEDPQRVLPFAGHVALLHDTSGRLSLEEVRAQPEHFTLPPPGASLGMGYQSGVYWLRLDVRSALTEPSHWRVEFSYPSLDRVEQYNIGQSDILLSQAGDTVPANQRATDHRAPVFDFTLEPGEQRELYWRVSTLGSMTLGGQVMSAKRFETHTQHGYIVHAIYLGVLLALGLYNLLLYTALRERPFINYVAFLASFAVSVLSLNGLGAQYLWPGGSDWSNRILPVSLTLTSLLAIVFARSFLDTGKWLPRLDTGLRTLAAITILALLLSTVVPITMALQIMSSTGLVVTTSLLIASTVCVGYNVPGARLFMLAWCMLLCGAVLLALRNFALVPTNFFTLHGLQIGSALEMILLSLALAARFNEHKRLHVTALQMNERALEQRVAERTQALEKANTRLRELAMQDPLTGLANRMALQQHLDMALGRNHRRGECLALMLIDLDDFKPINDRLGHEAGDRVLAEIAHRLQTQLREVDLPARLGGDEFVVVCENVQCAEAALELAQRLLATLEAPIELYQQPVQVSASIGLAMAAAQDTPTDLIRRADAAMYRAKAQGRHRICLSVADDPQSPEQTSSAATRTGSPAKCPANGSRGGTERARVSDPRRECRGKQVRHPWAGSSLPGQRPGAPSRASAPGADYLAAANPAPVRRDAWH